MVKKEIKNPYLYIKMETKMYKNSSIENGWTDSSSRHNIATNTVGYNVLRNNTNNYNKYKFYNNNIFCNQGFDIILFIKNKYLFFYNIIIDIWIENSWQVTNISILLQNILFFDEYLLLS
jgi:hypothetical protein